MAPCSLASCRPGGFRGIWRTYQEKRGRPAMMNGKRINPLSRRPRRQRLVVAVRGAAGTGKSVFAATLAEAGLGRLCYFDVERKARLMPGSDGTRFDALEVENPDELPEFIEWALTGEGRTQ